MNNEHTMNTTTEATLPTKSFPGRAVQTVALEHALPLARSANIELGLALALQCAWMEGTRTPGHVHALLALPRADLAERFRQLVRRQDSDTAKPHPSWKVLIRKALAHEAEYHSWVEPLKSAPGYTPAYYVSCLTSATGRLANQILGRSADSDEYWQLVADTAKNIKDCHFLHFP